MPVYPGSFQATSLQANSQGLAFNNEAIPAGTASVAFKVVRQEMASYPWGASFELFFSGAPGTFQFDIQTSDTDQDSHFVTIDSLTGSNLNPSNVARLELPIFFANFVRGRLVSITNSVNTSLLVSR